MPDTRIDEFLKDIAPFFRGQQITYVDAGAFEGHVFRAVASSAMVVGEAHLIEPNPDSYEAMEHALAEWEQCPLHTYNLGLGEKKSELEFIKNRTMTRVVSPERSSEVTPHPSHVEGQQEEHFTIQSHRLDMLLGNHAQLPIHLLKLDVEGHEIPVLKGARKLLTNQQIDVIYVEAGIDPANTQQTHLFKLDTFLRRYGYRIFRIYEQKHEWPTRSPLLRRVNVAYMSEAFAAQHPVDDD